MIVVAVGSASQWGVILKTLIVEPNSTPLQDRLDVPVLSALSCVALPIVSHASRRRTRFWSAIIFRIANAKPSVMARGRPSGIATTTIVTELMRYSRM